MKANSDTRWRIRFAQKREPHEPSTAVPGVDMILVYISFRFTFWGERWGLHGTCFKQNGLTISRGCVSRSWWKHSLNAVHNRAMHILEKYFALKSIHLRQRMVLKLNLRHKLKTYVHVAFFRLEPRFASHSADTTMMCHWVNKPHESSYTTAQARISTDIA